MAKPLPEFVTFLLEQLYPIGPVHARGMFGGHGIYLEDLMFGLVADETLYLKVDDGNRAFYEQQDLPPFIYQKNGKPYVMSYCMAPPDALEDSKQLCGIAQQAVAAAQRQRKPLKKRPSKKS